MLPSPRGCRTPAWLSLAGAIAFAMAACSSPSADRGAAADDSGRGTSDGSVPSGPGSGSGAGAVPPDASLFGSSSSSGGAQSDAALSSDGTPAVDGMSCVAGDAGPAPFAQRCVPTTNDECNGATDRALAALGVSGSLLNGMTGNG